MSRLAVHLPAVRGLVLAAALAVLAYTWHDAQSTTSATGPGGPAPDALSSPGPAPFGSAPTRRAARRPAERSKPVLGSSRSGAVVAPRAQEPILARVTRSAEPAPPVAEQPQPTDGAPARRKSRPKAPRPTRPDGGARDRPDESLHLEPIDTTAAPAPERPPSPAAPPTPDEQPPAPPAAAPEPPVDETAAGQAPSTPAPDPGCAADCEAAMDDTAVGHLDTSDLGAPIDEADAPPPEPSPPGQPVPPPAEPAPAAPAPAEPPVDTSASGAPVDEPAVPEPAAAPGLIA